MAAQTWPEPEDAATLYDRLMQADPVAPVEFVAAFLEPLIEYLRQEQPRVDDHLRIEAAEDAVLSVVKKPTIYKSDRGSLATFLRIAARGDLLNAIHREQRHHRKREMLDSVELEAAVGNLSQEDDSDLPSLDDPENLAIIAAMTETERIVLDLLRAGERRTAVIAAQIGLGDLPSQEQQREVKRVRDRIIKRFQRREGSRERSTPPPG